MCHLELLDVLTLPCRLPFLTYLLDFLPSSVMQKKRNFLELPLLDPLAWLDSRYVFMRESSRPLFYVLLGSTMDTCTCFGFWRFVFEKNATQLLREGPCFLRAHRYLAVTWEFLGDGFIFSTASGIWQSLVQPLPCQWYRKMGFFWETATS